MSTPDKDAVDLDLLDDPTASPRDRADDAALARLVRSRLQGLELPPSRVDVGAITRGATARAAGARRRAAWMVAGAVAAAAGVAAVVVLSGGLRGPAERQGSVATQSGGGTAAVPLRGGVPELPQDEVTRLEALQDRQPLAPPTYFAQPFSTWTTPVDCDSTWSELGVEPAVLDGLEASGLQQECATALGVGGSSGEDGARTATLLYRFYLPEGVGLDDVALAGATDRGVSWTVVDLAGPVEDVQPDDRPADAGGGVTTVRWADALASVHRWGADHTDITWVEPYARSGGDGTSAATVRAVVAADPVTAVRAAAGFTNQGGIRVVRGDDDSLLLVPANDPRGEMQALGGGALVRTPEGCLGLDQGAYGFQLVLWPYGTTWDAGSQVLTVPSGQGGAIDYRLGDEMGLGGGESDGQHAKALVPAGCASEKVWIGGSAVHLVDFQDSRESPAADAVAPFGDTGLQLAAVPLAGVAYAVVAPRMPETGGLRGSGDAKISGTLGVLIGGCLGITPEIAVVWPEGTTALPDGSGVQLADGDEVRVGDEIDTGGSYAGVAFTGRASGCPGSDVAFVGAGPVARAPALVALGEAEATGYAELNASPSP